jgi:hypothetical protein
MIKQPTGLTRSAVFIFADCAHVVTSPIDWPQWWHWELECSNPHLLKRMVDRCFTEVDLRGMLQRASAYRPDVQPGRWVIETTRAGQAWEVVVEPDVPAQLLVVVTAYAVG